MSKKNRFYTAAESNQVTIKEEPEMIEQTNQDNQQSIDEQPAMTTAPEESKVVEKEVVEQPVVKAPEPEKEVVQQPIAKDVQVEHVKADKPSAKAEVKQPAATSDTNEFDIVINNAATSTSQRLLTINGFLDGYVKTMVSGAPVDSKKGGTTQFNLYSTIVQIINQPKFEDFKNGLILLLAYMRKYETNCFSERLIFRFAEEWPSSSDKLTHFHALLNLLKIIANPKERPVGKYVSLERTFNSGFTETAKDNFMKFIGK